MPTRRASKANRPFPESGANTLRDNAKSATEIAASADPARTDKSKAAAANAEVVTAAAAQLDEKEREAEKDLDNSIFGKINRSGLVMNRNQVSGEEWVGESVQLGDDPAAKLKTKVDALTSVPPRTGMVVKLKDGTAFSIPDGFNQDSKPDDWAKVTNPSSGKSLFG